ncbi:unnamed protein product [Sphagnum compactum]
MLAIIGDAEDCSFVRILAGKGGFGAQLRSLAKQKGAKRTVDFSACRDLNGRRLRHVNNELILKNWKEATDRGEKFDVEQQTSTGIDLWFLNVLRTRFKSVLCSDWIDARKHGNPPPQASIHWGCPRGQRCEFAHGEEELRGAGKRVMGQFDEQSRRENLRNAEAAFLSPLDRAARSDDDYSSLIAEGLQASKRSRREETVAAPQAVVNMDVAQTSSQLLQVLSGSSMAQQEPDGLLYLKGLSKFTSVIIVDDSEPSTSDVRGLRHYYEVTLLSDGLMQIGWCTDKFSGGNDEAGDGVGDDETGFSWAFDGMRQVIIHGGFESAFSLRLDQAAWQAGDVIGCLLDIQRGNEKKLLRMAFAVEGRCIQAFQTNFDLCEDVFIPALSLEKDEEILVNIGKSTFRYNPEALVIEALNENTVQLDLTPQSPKATTVVETKVFDEIPLDTVSTVAQLEEFGLDHLKAELARRGLKVGGSLSERASRLMAVKVALQRMATFTMIRYYTALQCNVLRTSTTR